jgi:signal transduction histidine kinase
LLTSDFSSEEILAYADPAQVDQAMDRLVSNALRNTSHGGQVSMRVEKMIDGQVHCLVRNSLAEVETQQLNLSGEGGKGESSRRSTNGSQLLSQVKDIISAHGGKVWVESNPGQGSVFHFTLLPPA